MKLTATLLICLFSVNSALADSGGAPHSHAPEGPLIMKVIGGALIVMISLVVYFGVIKKNKK